MQFAPCDQCSIEDCSQWCRWRKLLMVMVVSTTCLP